MCESRLQNVFHTVFYIVYQSLQPLKGSLSVANAWTHFDRFCHWTNGSKIITFRALSNSKHRKQNDQSVVSNLSHNSRNSSAILVRASFPFVIQLPRISLAYPIVAIDRPSTVLEHKLSSIHRSHDLIFLSISENVRIIVDDGSKHDRDSVNEKRNGLHSLSANTSF